MKLTAQFVARYDMYFLAGLIERVATNSQFEFLKESDSKFDYFTQLVVVYSRIIMRSKRKGACTETLLKVFFDRLQTQIERQEGVEMVESDLDAIVGCVDYFAHMEDQVSCTNVPQPEPLLMGMVHALYQAQVPKRQKFDDPALVPLDQFIVQRSVMCILTVFVSFV